MVCLGGGKVRRFELLAVGRGFEWVEGSKVGTLSSCTGWRGGMRKLILRSQVPGKRSGRVSWWNYAFNLSLADAVRSEFSYHPSNGRLRISQAVNCQETRAVVLVERFSCRTASSSVYRVFTVESGPDEKINQSG